MDEIVSYHFEDGVAVITLDDGKVNALSPTMIMQINKALDHAAADGAVTVLTGRPGIFSGGFDLKVMRSGPEGAAIMLAGGFDLAERLLGFDAPVVVACAGHAIAMGLFLNLTGDYRVGVDGPYRVVANEVAIGMTMPKGIVELCRMRLTPSAFSRSLSLAAPFSGQEAVAAGFFDCAVDETKVLEHATSYARELTSLHRDSFIATKRRVRADGIAAVRRGFEADARERAMLLGAPSN